jgi:hypothetical protein
VALQSASVIAEALFFPDAGESYACFLAYLAAPVVTIDVCVFTLTDNNVARILLAHHAKGVRVRIITDNDTSGALGSDIESLSNAGIPVGAVWVLDLSVCVGVF